MFATDLTPNSRCTKCGKMFSAPSYTKNGSDVWGMCQECLDREKNETD